MMSWAEKVRRAMTRGRDDGGAPKVARAGSKDISDEVPDEVVDRAKAAFRRRSVGEVAALVHDSLVDGGDPATDYRLRFEHPLVEVDLRVTSGPEGIKLNGHIEPPVSIRVELELDAGDISLLEEVVEGAFTFGRVDHGVIRLRLRNPGGTPIDTDWFRV
jgi:hypothetical protein